MVAAALADGEMAPEEREMIHQHLGEGGLTPEQTRQVHKDLVLPPSPGELAAMVSEPSHHDALYRAALLVVRADEDVTGSEEGFLQRFGEALGLSEDTRRALEADLLGALRGVHIDPSSD